MLESIKEFWYLWVVFLVLLVIFIFVARMASKAVKKKNEIIAKQHEQLKRYSDMIQNYTELTAEKVQSASAKDLAEGVMCVLQHQVEKSGDPDAEYENAEKWRREVYALFYFDEDVTETCLSDFFRFNGGPLPKAAVDGIESIGYDKIKSVAGQMYAMCDDKNESVSFDKERIAELDEKFRNIYNRDEFFNLIKEYITANV